MIILIKFAFLAAIFFLIGCGNVKNKMASDLSMKYEIVDIKSCSLVTHIEGGGHIYSQGITKKINAEEKYFLKNDDLVYLEKGSLAVVEASDKSKILLGSRQKKSSYRIKHEMPATEHCK